MAGLRFGLLAAFGVLLASGIACAEGSGFAVLSSDADRVVLEFTLPDVRVEASDAGPYYVRLEAPGLTVRGAPRAPLLPATAALLAAPADRVPDVTVLEADYRTLAHLRVAPAPVLTAPADPTTGAEARYALVEGTAYGDDAFLPGPLASPGFVGAMRDRPVAQVLLFPVQYNPVRGEVRVYHRIRVLVRFVDAPAAGARAKPGGAGTVPVPAGDPGGPYDDLRARVLLHAPGAGP